LSLSSFVVVLDPGRRPGRDPEIEEEDEDEEALKDR
jgi:hypothetical protein